MALRKDVEFLLFLSAILVWNVCAYPYPRSAASEQFTKPYARYRNIGQTNRWLNFNTATNSITQRTESSPDVDRQIEAPEMDRFDIFRNRTQVWRNSMFSFMFAEADQTSPTDVAASLSGLYYALNSKYVDTSKSCPGEVKLLANVSDGSIQIPLPDGLYDPLGLCNSQGEINESNIVLSDKAAFSSRILTIAKMHRIAPIRKALMGKMPENLIQCPGDTDHPFSSITVTPLNRYLIPMLVQNLKAVGVPKHTIEDVFRDEADEENSPYSFESLWGLANGVRCKQAVREALSYLSNDYVLSLNREHTIQESKVIRLYQRRKRPARHIVSSTLRRSSKEENGLGGKIRAVEQNGNFQYPVHEPHSPSCVLLGGSAERDESEANMKKFVVSLNLIVTLLQLPLPKLASESFYPTNANCKYCSKSANLGRIKILSKSSTLHYGPWGMAPKFSVSINGDNCASMQIYRFAQARTKINETRAIWRLATRITEYLEEHGPVPPPQDEMHPTFISYFPNLQKSLQSIRFKTAVFVAQMEFQCNHHFMAPMEVVLVKKPASFFYCRGFTEENPSVSSVCDGHVIAAAASPEPMATPSVEDIESTVFGSISEYTAFIAAEGSSSTCIYSTSKSEASQFRSALIKAGKAT